MIAWERIDRSAKGVELLPQYKPSPKMNLNESVNSDMQEAYHQEGSLVDWRREFLKIRFTTPYLVFKLRRLWFLLDKCS